MAAHEGRQIARAHAVAPSLNHNAAVDVGMTITAISTPTARVAVPQGVGDCREALQGQGRVELLDGLIKCCQ